jgi:hypothetical protein
MRFVSLLEPSGLWHHKVGTLVGVNVLLPPFSGQTTLKMETVGSLEMLAPFKLHGVTSQKSNLVVILVHFTAYKTINKQLCLNLFFIIILCQG